MKTEGINLLKSSIRSKLDFDDAAVIIMVVGLSIFGLFMVYSASFYQAESLYGDKFLYLKKQLVGVLMGFVIMIATIFTPNVFFKKFWIILPVISVLLLILVFIPKIGVENYGARRWINLGFMTIQPSEICKLAIVLFSATYFSNKWEITPSI